MKKLTIIASAIVAVLAASSCSNDELEPIVEKKGTPLSITVSSIGDTRGANVVTSGLQHLNLTAKQGTTTWANDVTFNYASSVWTGEATWPTEDKTTASNFYVISENATGTKSYSTTNVTNYLTSGTTFNYTVPDPVFAGSGATMTETAQPDLLVATASQAEGDGPLALELEHALANIQIKAVFPAENYSGGTWGAAIDLDQTPDAFYRIYKIIIHNIYKSGQFDYSNMASTPWAAANLSNKGDIEIDFSSNPIDIPCVSVENEGSTIPADKYTTIIPADAAIRVIPQAITTWGANHSSNVALDETSDTYLELIAFAAQSELDWIEEDEYFDTAFWCNNEDYTNESDLGTSVFVPIKLTNNALGYNTNHTFKINLLKSSYYGTGEYALDGISISD